MNLLKNTTKLGNHAIDLERALRTVKKDEKSNPIYENDLMDTSDSIAEIETPNINMAANSY
jgi:hypothetical protein